MQRNASSQIKKQLLQPTIKKTANNDEEQNMKGEEIGLASKNTSEKIKLAASLIWKAYNCLRQGDRTQPNVQNVSSLFTYNKIQRVKGSNMSGVFKLICKLFLTVLASAQLNLQEEFLSCLD